MKYYEAKGDLFNINPEKWVLAHCISADVTKSKNMNKGIAKQFRKNFPKMAAKIEPDLRVGRAIRYKKDKHIIYNLVSKEKVWQKAKGDYKNQYYAQLRDALLDMKNQMVAHEEGQLAMPKIASGLDGGNWEDIREMIQKMFYDTEIEIKVRYLEEDIKIGTALYSIEKAKSGRSTCRSCDERIANNTLRLKERIPTQNYMQTKYYCKKCAIEILENMEKRATQLLEKIQD